MEQKLPPRRVLRRDQVLSKTGLSRTSLYNLEKVQDFPRHFMLTPRCAAWFEDEIDEWLDARCRAAIAAAEAPVLGLRQIFRGRGKRKCLAGEML